MKCVAQKWVIVTSLLHRGQLLLVMQESNYHLKGPPSVCAETGAEEQIPEKAFILSDASNIV